MIIGESEARPELDWMLQSDPVSNAALAQALADAYFPGLYRFGLAALGEAGPARQAAVGALAEAVAGRRRFWGQMPLRLFLYRRTFAQARSLSRRSWGRYPVSGAHHLLPNLNIRLTLVLQALEGLDEEALGLALGVSQTAAARRLNQGQTWLRLLWGLASQQAFTARLKGEIDRLYPPPPTSQEAFIALQAEVMAGAARRLNRQQALAAARGWVVMAAVAGLLAVVAGWVNRDTLYPQPTPTPTLAVSPTPVARVDSLPMLTAHASETDVRQRLLASSELWGTLFIDGFVFDYGPQGYIGPPAAYRNQLWINKPHHMVALMGEQEGPPQVFIAANQRWLRRVWLDTSQVVEMELEIPEWWRSLADNHIPSVRESLPLASEDFYLYQMLFPRSLWFFNHPMVVEGADEVFGAPAVVVSFSESGGQRQRLWIHARYGIVLAWQTFSEERPEELEREMILTSASFDTTFPDDWFMQADFLAQTERIDSWDSLWLPEAQSGLLPAMRWEGARLRARLAPTPAPPHFDAASSRMSFEYDPDSGEDSTRVFGGMYLLGEVEIGDPRKARCERSPDGQYIAIIHSTDLPRFPAESLQLIHLPDLKIQPLLVEGSKLGSDVAYSPDGQWLAFSGCTGSECGVYAHRLETGKNVWVARFQNSGYFTWSPDSRYLALVGVLPEQGVLILAARLFVIDLKSGLTVYSGDIDRATLQAPQDSPVVEWGVPFPPVGQGLEGCVDPPVFHP